VLLDDSFGRHAICATIFFMGAASRMRVVLSVLALSSAACVSTDAPRVPERLVAAPAPADRLMSVASPPEWRPGDRWTYDLTSGNDRGTKTMEVVEVREIDKVLYYVGALRRCRSLLHAYSELGRGDQRRESRSPHDSAASGIRLAARGRQALDVPGVWEDQNSKLDLNDRFAVVAVRRSRCWRAASKHSRSFERARRRSSDEYWFAPAVRSYVRWVGRRGDLRFEERFGERRVARYRVRRNMTTTPGTTLLASQAMTVSIDPRVATRARPGTIRSGMRRGGARVFYEPLLEPKIAAATHPAYIGPHPGANQYSSELCVEPSRRS